ncbi:MAG: hypothetical protein JETT_2666 [Candidatus Jettenia ecosi]|uniref:Uncharacterized protein n=1 Tax=Candidatus Jettenia ecosi TaxID=2494326 RepID=A0A533Q8P6_9BACT|nr:MAG: hypothetical protein JETT_2666 [Candidatus Jettenia ecosi]
MTKRKTGEWEKIRKDSRKVPGDDILYNKQSLFKTYRDMNTIQTKTDCPIIDFLRIFIS